MTKTTLIKRAIVDGEELVCVAPWYWDEMNKTMEALAQPQPIDALDPDMPADELRLHMGELTADEVLVARAAIRLANTRPQPQPIDVEGLKREVISDADAYNNTYVAGVDECIAATIDHLASRGYLRTPVNRQDVADFNPINFTTKGV